MAKRFMVLAVVFAAAIVVAVPAFAQEGPYEGEEISVTGVVENFGSAVEGSSPYGLRDETSGGVYYLAGDYDFGSYENERITAHGTTEEVGRSVVLHVSRIEPAGGSGGGTVTVTFELTVEGQPPAGTEFFGNVGRGQVHEGYALLLDEDGDRVYTASLPVKRGVEYEIWFEQGTPLDNGDPQAPLSPTIIKAYGPTLISEDETFSATVYFTGDGGHTGGDYQQEEAADYGVGDGAEVLPATGGMALLTMGLGVLLAAGGFLVYRATR